MGDSLITIRSADSAHWYDKDANPRHDATLREARKENLYPSVTSYLSIKEKPALINWKVAQMLGQALTMHREPDESDDAFIERVKAADEAERAKAPDLGSLVHQILAEHLREPITAYPDIGVDLTPVGKWINGHVTSTGEVEKCFASPLGFGGCIDYIGNVDGQPAIIDWKTQAVKVKVLKSGAVPDPAFYDDWVWQLAAYNAAFDKMGCAVYSVIIDTRAPGCYVKLWKPEDVQRGWEGFQGCMAVWQADRKYKPEAR